MSTMTDKMSQAGSGKPATKQTQGHVPKKGERFHCEQCGMEIQVTKECRCDDPDHIHFECCNQDMQRV